MRPVKPANGLRERVFEKSTQKNSMVQQQSFQFEFFVDGLNSDGNIPHCAMKILIKVIKMGHLLKIGGINDRVQLN